MKLAVLMTAVVIAGCTSPETSRSRGGGPGADTGNRTSIVRMHEGSKPFEKTPQIITSKHPPLESALQADHLSRQ